MADALSLSTDRQADPLRLSRTILVVAARCFVGMRSAIVSISGILNAGL